jgi:MFS transporter, FSR family, fosmidomycin resistance protein
MSSAFAAMVVYAQEAVPGRVGMIAGLMFGLMFERNACIQSHAST